MKKTAISITVALQLFNAGAGRTQTSPAPPAIETAIESNTAGITDKGQFIENAKNTIHSLEQTASKNMGKPVTVLSTPPVGPNAPAQMASEVAGWAKDQVTTPSKGHGLADKKMDELLDTDTLSKNPEEFAKKFEDLYEKRNCQYNPGSCSTQPTSTEKKPDKPKEIDPSKLNLKNATFICTPLEGTSIGQVRTNPNLQFKNECSVGNGIAIGPTGQQQSVGFIFVTCKGWSSPTITRALSDFPEKTAGKIQKDYQTKTLTYLGHGFITPCRPEGGVDIKGGLKQIEKLFEPFVK